MNRKLYLFYTLFLLILFVKCKSKNDCSIKLFNFANNEYQAEGCLIKNLEQGEWHFLNSNLQLTEKGVYENGLRKGNWYYPLNNVDSIISWKKYEKRDLKLIFNIPTLLEMVEDSSDYIKFSNNDSSNLFNIVISIHELEKTKKSIDDYYKQGEEEIITNGWSFTSKKNKIITPNRILFFNEYLINKTSSQNFNVLNIFALFNKKQIFEISCRYSENIETSAKIIFFSILTNIFIKNERFINPFESIKFDKIN